jgi:hypothetical protein
LSKSLRSVLDREQARHACTTAVRSRDRIAEIMHRQSEFESKVISSNVYVSKNAKRSWEKLRSAQLEFRKISNDLEDLLLQISQTRNVSIEERLVRLELVNKPFQELIPGLLDDFEDTCSSTSLEGSEPRVSKNSSEKFPRDAQQILRDWFFAHFENPYPTKSEKHELCQKTQISMHQLNQWFTNSRLRLWKRAREADKSSRESEISPSDHVETVQGMTSRRKPKFSKLANEMSPNNNSH